MICQFKSAKHERLIADLLFPLCKSTMLTFIMEIAHPKIQAPVTAYLSFPQFKGNTTSGVETHKLALSFFLFVFFKINAF